MAGKYHLTPDGPKPCRATKRACKYGSGEHYEDQAEAHIAFAEQLQQQNGLLKTNKKVKEEEIESNEVLESDDNFVLNYWRNKNGQLHRTDGPAKEWANGDKEWYLNGELHRVDGPAIERANGDKEWYMDGELHNEEGPAFVNSNRDKEYWVHGKLHRINGPAIEYANGNSEYWVNGQLHRTDGPAIVDGNGSEEWYQDGFLHRLDGPAIKKFNGVKKYYLEGIEYDEEEFKKMYPNAE